MKKYINVLLIISFILSLSNSINAQFSNLRLKAHPIGSPEEVSDETVIIFYCGATDGYDPCCDASKLMNTDPTYPNIYSIISGFSLTLQGLPQLINCRIDTLGFKVGTSGKYSITASEINDFPSGTQIIIIDSVLHQKQDLTLNPVYGPFDFNITDSKYRFYIYFKLEICHNLQAKITPEGPTTFDIGGSVKLNSNTGLNYTYQWQKDEVNMDGITTETYTADSSGSYSVVVTENSNSVTSCGVIVTVNSFVGINKAKPIESETEIFPNPTNDKIYILSNSEISKDYIISIFDIKGLLISIRYLNFSFMNSSTTKFHNSIVMDVSSLTKGVYFLRIQNNEKIECKKLMIF